MPSHSSPWQSTLPLIAALKWGTVSTSFSIGTEIWKDSSWMFVCFYTYQKRTVGPKWNSKKQILCSKQASFQRAWHVLKALTRLIPLGSKDILFGGFKRGAYIPEAQRTAKFWLVKVWKCPSILWNKQTPNLTSHNFEALWATLTSSNFLNAFNVTLDPTKQGCGNTLRMSPSL